MKFFRDKLYTKIFIVTFFVFWFLGVLRFYWSPAEIIWGIIGFPFGAVFIIVERSYWNTLGPNHWLNSEIIGGFVWLMMLLAQSAVYCFIIEKWLTKNHQSE
jgi:hypothetical protein